MKVELKLLNQESRFMMAMNASTRVWSKKKSKI
jgi:hypothetical protein